jgi:hypothetical protein
LYRVARIRELTNLGKWRHIPTAINPADCLSRGLDPARLAGNNLWWYGPPFLLREREEWPNAISLSSFDCEEEGSVIALPATISANDTMDRLINRSSNIARSCRILAYILRFLKISKGEKPMHVCLRPDKVERALMLMVKHAQNVSFSREIDMLRTGRIIKRGKLLGLSPFLDENDILRVGGRLMNSSFCTDKKFPIIIDSAHVLTKLIMAREHLRLLHAGPQLLLTSSLGSRQVLAHRGEKSREKDCP